MADIVSGLLFVVLSGVVFSTAAQLPAGRGNAPGPGFFPEIVAVVGVVVGLAICVRAVIALRASAAAASAAAASAAAASAAAASAAAASAAGAVGRPPPSETLGDMLRFVGLLAVSAAYVVALKPAGFLLASLLLLVISLIILGERRVLILLLVPAGLTGGVLFIFSSLLGLRLPAGTLF